MTPPTDPVADARHELAKAEAERADALAKEAQTLADNAAARAQRRREMVTGSAPGR